MCHLQLTSQPKPTFDEVKVDVGGDMLRCTQGVSEDADMGRKVDEDVSAKEVGSIAERFNVGDKVGVGYFMGFKEENDGLHFHQPKLEFHYQKSLIIPDLALQCQTPPNYGNFVQQIGGRTVKVNFPKVPRGGEREAMGPKIRRSNKEFIESPHKIYAGKIFWIVTSEKLKDALADEPGLFSAKVIYEKHSGRSRDFGFVTFSYPEADESALSARKGMMYILRRVSMLAIRVALNLQCGGVRDFCIRFLSSRPAGGSGRRDEVVAHIFYLLRKEETYNEQAKLTEWILQMPNDVVLYWNSYEIKVEWGNGLAQEREAEEARTEEMKLQKTKPFARTRDDSVIERMLKEKVRWGDPMKHFVKVTALTEDLATNNFFKRYRSRTYKDDATKMNNRKRLDGLAAGSILKTTKYKATHLLNFNLKRKSTYTMPRVRFITEATICNRELRAAPEAEVTDDNEDGKVSKWHLMLLVYARGGCCAHPKDDETPMQYARLVWELRHDQDRALGYFSDVVLALHEDW
ncbi:33 kDa ribonucleoprotein, chloroplastic [Tanacetum coccineum]